MLSFESEANHFAVTKEESKANARRLGVIMHPRGDEKGPSGEGPLVFSGMIVRRKKNPPKWPDTFLQLLVGNPCWRCTLLGTRQ